MSDGVRVFASAFVVGAGVQEVSIEWMGDGWLVKAKYDTAKRLVPGDTTTAQPAIVAALELVGLLLQKSEKERSVLRVQNAIIDWGRVRDPR